MSTFRQTGLKKTKGLKKHHTNNLLLLNNGPQKRGIIIKLRIMSPKKPNSAKRRVVKLRVPSMRRNLVAKLKGQGSNLQSYSKVLVCGGRANDLPGVRYNMVKGVYDFGWQENIIRKKGRSKYGMRIEDLVYAIERKLEEENKKKKSNIYFKRFFENQYVLYPKLNEGINKALILKKNKQKKKLFILKKYNKSITSFFLFFNKKTSLIKKNKFLLRIKGISLIINKNNQCIQFLWKKKFKKKKKIQKKFYFNKFKKYFFVTHNFLKFIYNFNSLTSLYNLISLYYKFNFSFIKNIKIVKILPGVKHVVKKFKKKINFQFIYNFKFSKLKRNKIFWKYFKIKKRVIFFKIKSKYFFKKFKILFISNNTFFNFNVKNKKKYKRKVKFKKILNNKFPKFIKNFFKQKTVSKLIYLADYFRFFLIPGFSEESGLENISYLKYNNFTFKFNYKWFRLFKKLEKINKILITKKKKYFYMLWTLIRKKNYFFRLNYLKFFKFYLFSYYKYKKKNLKKKKIKIQKLKDFNFFLHKLLNKFIKKGYRKKIYFKFLKVCYLLKKHLLRKKKNYYSLVNFFKLIFIKIYPVLIGTVYHTTGRQSKLFPFYYNLKKNKKNVSLALIWFVKSYKLRKEKTFILKMLSELKAIYKNTSYILKQKKKFYRMLYKTRTYLHFLKNLKFLWR